MDFDFIRIDLESGASHHICTETGVDESFMKKKVKRFLQITRFQSGEQPFEFIYIPRK